VQSFREMSNISKKFRRDLDRTARIGWLRLADRRCSADGTVKYAWQLDDGAIIESVLIPETDRLTLCISSQVGCPLRCLFCATGLNGFARNLTSSEILGQIIGAQRDSERRISNVVLMGMGEPLLNLEQVLRATGIAMYDEGLNMSHRRITLSTVGLMPQLAELGRRSEINLAVSLHASTQEMREALMPTAARKLPLDQLMAACRAFPLPHRKLISFEYILFGGINDDLGDARRLIRLLHGVRAKVNLIPFNAHAGSPYRAPTAEAVLAYQERLRQSHVHGAIRAARGTDIGAACGCLAGHVQAR
jgi:23S rRNA (adenine2503-C2)-methyltransferase